jgi:hypothetical protein
MKFFFKPNRLGLLERLVGVGPWIEIKARSSDEAWDTGEFLFGPGKVSTMEPQLHSNVRHPDEMTDK